MPCPIHVFWLGLCSRLQGPQGASITVGGVQRGYDSGDVFCFDDSYEHSVRNGGGEHANVTRVVFDVTFWHPKLEAYYL